MESMGVIGGGSWGTALARLLAGKGYPVTLWTYEEQVAQDINRHHENSTYLPGFSLPDHLVATNDLLKASMEKDMVVLVPPSQHLRPILERLAFSPGTVLVSASKGIENDTLMTMSEVIAQVASEEVAARTVFLSGPNFAREVARQLPAATVVASRDEKTAQWAQRIFNTSSFRVYTHRDVRGVELGGALKNVMAVACGISDGLGLGDNTRAALITRGLAEICRMGSRLGASPETFFGLSGMGDLVLTCTGGLSRNRKLGMELGKGRSLQDILSGMNMVAEGVYTSLSAFQLAAKVGVETPIINEVYRVLYENKSPQTALTDLMIRALKAEN